VVAVGIATVGASQAEQIGNVLMDATKPSATECEFSGQRLSEKYFCVYRNANGQQYFDVEKIREDHIPPICSNVRMESATLDANGVGSVYIVKPSGCTATIKSISLSGIVQISNRVLTESDTRVFIPLNIGTSMQEGSSVTINMTWERGSMVQSVGILPAGTSNTVNPSTSVNPSNDNQQQLMHTVTGGKEISPYQRIFVRELYNNEGTLPAYTGIHTSYAKSVSISVEADSLVIATIEGSDCVIQGNSFDRMCDVPSNSDVILKVEGVGKAHVIVRLHYIL
jgi:hypothetical protein